MIKFVTGDFFEYPAEIRVNTVNCVGVMGAGVALLFKKKFPKMFDEYAKACSLGEVKIGFPHVWQENNIFDGQGVTIINFPTKDHWRKPSEYIFVEKGLKWLRQFLKNRGRVRVTLPALGCGHGGLDWGIVKPMITDYLENLEADIFVFEPSEAIGNEIYQNIELDLKENGILTIDPKDDLYPSRLLDAPPTRIFVKGNPKLISSHLLTILVDPKAIEREMQAVNTCIDALPSGVTYLMGFNSSLEIELAKKIIERRECLILLIPYGILEIRIRKDLKQIWDWDRIAIVSISEPHEKWNPNQSLRSLDFRLQIANVALLSNLDYEKLKKVEKYFLRAKGILYYINYWTENIDFFKRIGAIQIGRDRETNKPNLHPILRSLNFGAESNDLIR